jgi:integrase
MASKVQKIGPRTVEGLRVGDILWDSELKRFGARRRRRGITYFVKVRIDRAQRWITLGRHGPLTPAGARLKARQVLGQVDSGADPTRLREASATVPTVTDFARRWLTEHVAVKRKANTLREYRRVVQMYLQPAIGTLRIDRVGTEDVLKIHSDLAKVPYQANRAVAVLSAILAFAELTGQRDRFSNPCRNVERYRERKRKRPLTLTELRALWTYLATLDERVSPFVLAAFRLLLLTGVRRDELLTLRWTDVDLVEGVIRLPDAKAGPRDVVLSPQAIEVFATLPRLADNPFVLPGRKAGQRLVNISRTWAGIRKELGFPSVRIHDMRHTVGSLLADRAPLIVVRDALGHREINTTNGYSHTEARAVREALSAMGDLIVGGQQIDN